MTRFARSKELISSNETQPGQASPKKQIVNKEKQKKKESLQMEIVKAAEVSVKEGKLQNNKNNGKNKKNNIEKKNQKVVNATKKLNQKNKNNQNKGQNNKTGPSQSTNEAQGQKRKIAKERDNDEHKRRKITGEDKLTFVVDGVKEELVHFQGILVRKSDADRLKVLRKTMYNEGKPKSEIEPLIKAERRKAEKRISRVRKHVCFHCRKSGHLLSNCPELNNGTNPIGSPICFICKEPGHISRECPDNTKGLYPNGGSCKLCGEVTHYKKNCPKTMQEKLSKDEVVDTI